MSATPLPAGRFWTTARLFRLAELTDRGWSDERIAAALSHDWLRPISARAIVTVRSRYGLTGQRAAWLSSVDVGRLLGVGHERVAVWVRNGWLAGRQGRSSGRGHAWMIRHAALWAFVADPLYWPLWEPEAVTDAALRRHVATVRGAPVYVRVSAVAPWLRERGIYAAPKTVQHWVRTGRLPSLTLPLSGPVTPRLTAAWRVVPVAALDAFAPPCIGGNRRREAA